MYRCMNHRSQPSGESFELENSKFLTLWMERYYLCFTVSRVIVADVCTGVARLAVRWISFSYAFVTWQKEKKKLRL